jgi:lysophospholipase L1-like esterase
LHTEDGALFDWSGSAVEGGFKGTAASVRLHHVEGATTDYFNVYVDGSAPRVLVVTAEQTVYPLVDGLTDTYHSVRLEKRTEGPQSAVWAFDGFDFGSGTAAPAPARKASFIEIAGDSITAGFGNLSANGWSGFKLVEEDVSRTYGRIAADWLDADVSVLGWSGAGLYQDLGGTKYPVFSNNIFRRTLSRRDCADWEFDRKPDVLVINLGTNDFQANVVNPVEGFAEAYVACYTAFLEEVRALYPETHIVCAAGIIHYYAVESVEAVVAARKAAGDEAVSVCVLNADRVPVSKRWGGDGHPSALAHAAMGAQLAAHIAEKMGW